MVTMQTNNKIHTLEQKQPPKFTEIIGIEQKYCITENKNVRKRVKNVQSRDIDNIGHTTQDEDKQNTNREDSRR